MSAAPALLAVVTTVGDMDTARDIARALVERRLCACVQLAAIESCYRWDGAVQHEPEVRLVCKTTQAGWPALRDAILERHPYTLPAVHAVAVEAAHEAYAQWVQQQCTNERD